MEQNKKTTSQQEVPALDLDFHNFSDFDSIPAADRFQFQPRFDDETANPFLDTPLMEIPQEPEKTIVSWKRSPISLLGGLLFYAVVILCVVLSVYHTHSTVNTLDEKLEAYERSQSPHFAEELFQQYFAEPDWGTIYDTAAPDIQSQYEGKDAYIRYIQEKVGDEPLTYRYLRDLSENRMEYGVYLQKEQVASFTMVNTSEDAAAPQWDFESMKLFYTTAETYYIEHTIGHTVRVNGTLLDESSLVKSTKMLPTNALKMLASQFPVMGTNIYEVQGLMSQPIVTIEDSEGKPVEVSFDEESQVFSESAKQQMIPQDIESLALDAVRTYCEYMIRKANGSQLSKYFQTGTDTYRSIAGSDREHFQHPESYSFAEETVSGLTYYMEDFYSVDVSLTMNLTREDGSVKQDLVEKSLFFEKNQNDKWLCTHMTSEKLFDEVTTVRVKFVQDGNVLSSRMINQKEEFIYCPDAEVPTQLPDNTPAHNMKQEVNSQLEKIVFAGWGQLLQDKMGKPFYQPVFQVGLDRKAEVPGGLLEEPITLYPLFVWEKVK